MFTFIKKTNHVYSIVLLIFLGFLVYSNSLRGEFLWDDYFLITNNSFVQHWSAAPFFFTRGIEAGATSKACYYRPFLMLTLMFDYSLWKNNVIGFHSSTIVFHVLASLLIYYFIILLFHHRAVAFVVSALFVVHPIHVEDVAYITGRANSLGLIFMLLAFIFYLHSLQTGKKKFVAAMVLSYLCSLLSKENSIVLPFLIMLYHFVFKKKIPLGRLMVLFALSVGYLTLYVIILKSFFQHTLITTTFLQRLPGFFVAVLFYIRLIFFPFDIPLSFGQLLFFITNPFVITGISLALFLLVYSFLRRNKEPLLFFSIGWFFITLLPVSNVIIQANGFMNERYAYVPSLGILLLLSQGLLLFINKIRMRLLGLTLVAGVLLFYSAVTISKNEHWKDPVTYFHYAIKRAPYAPELYYNLGFVYYTQGNLEKSVAFYKKALKMDPNFYFAYNNLGVIYRSHDIQQSINYFQKAVSMSPSFVEAQINLGSTYAFLGKYDKALLHLKKATEITPGSAQAYYNLGCLYSETNQPRQAIQAYRQALRINPYLAEVYNNLGIIYAQEGEIDNAIDVFKKSIANHSIDEKPLLNIAVLYANNNQLDAALAYFKKALFLNPNNIEIYCSVARIFFLKNNYSEARRYYIKASQRGGCSDPELDEKLLVPDKKLINQ